MDGLVLPRSHKDKTQRKEVKNVSSHFLFFCVFVCLWLELLLIHAIELDVSYSLALCDAEV